MEPEETRRRIRAARVLADIPSVKELADRIDVKGLGRDTLYNIESGRRTVRPHELRLIAEATGLPYEFFTVDLNQLMALRALPPDITDTLEELVRDLRTKATEAVAAAAGATPPAGGAPPQPPGELGRRIAAPPTSAEREEPTQSPPAVGRGRGADR